jgi:hypothetical protein
LSTLRKILSAISEQAEAIGQQLKRLYDSTFIRTGDRPGGSSAFPGKIEAPDLNADPNEVVIDPIDPQPDGADRDED